MRLIEGSSGGKQFAGSLMGSGADSYYRDDPAGDK